MLPPLACALCLVGIAASSFAQGEVSEKEAIAQYGEVVRQMQQDAAALVSDAMTGQPVTSHAVTGHPVPPKACPAVQASLGEESLMEASLSQASQPLSGLSQASLKIFVSFSMGDEALRNLAASLAKLKTGSLVMRGLYQNSFQKTALKLKELGISVTIDPEAFERFNVTSVPQFVLTSDRDTSVTGQPVDTSPHDTLRGNVSVDFALSQFADKGDTASLAKPLLKALRGEL